MNNYEHPSDSKTKQTLPQDTSVFPYMRNPTNFYRRPSFFPVRNRMAPRQYPNMGFRFRSFPSPFYRPNCQVRGVAPYFRQPHMLNPAIMQRPPLPSANFNTLEKQNVLSPLPQRQISSSSTEIQTSSSSLEQPEQQYPSKACPDLWIEASAQGGRRYYYNERTRERSWIKPMNVRVIEQEEMKHINYSQFGPPKNICQESSFVQRLSYNPLQNSYGCFSVPSRLMMFPQAHNMYQSPQLFFVPNTTSIQNNISCNFHVTTFPYAFSAPDAADDLIPNSETFNAACSADEENGILQQPDTHADFNSKAFISNEIKVSDWNSLETELSFCSSVSAAENNESTEEYSLIKDDTNLSNLTSESEQYQNKMIEKSRKPTQNARDGKEVDKSRPMCSTPVAGTSWHVVWTGDEKVFFFDSSRKTSVWDRPAELMNRNEVDKLIEKPPFTMDVKQTKKDVRKTTSDGSDVVKKLKTENGKQGKNSDQGHSPKEDENHMKENDGTKSNVIPREERRNIFYEMLTDNKVSAFSTWENELHKVNSDSSVIIPTKEHSPVFETYPHKKSEEKDTHQKELTNQKRIFISLLKEAGVTAKSQFCDLVNQYANDERFKAIEKIKHRENIFNHYVSKLAEKEREDERLKADQRKYIMKKFHDNSCYDNDKLKVPKSSSSNIRNSEIEEDVVNRRLYEEPDQAESPNEQFNCNISDREEEVKRDLSVASENRERDQNIQEENEAISNFITLLNDFIRCSDINWYTAQRILKEDHRWDLSEYLDIEERERLFHGHIDLLIWKNKEQFHRLLDEIPDVSFKTSWLDIRKYVLKDQRCSNFSISERMCENEFKEYLKEKFMYLKTEFKELLQTQNLLHED